MIETLNRLPAPLRGLKWQKVGPEKEWSDGDYVLAAILVSPRGKPEEFKYTIAVVTVNFVEPLDDGSGNGGYMELLLDGEPWYMEPEHIDLYVDLEMDNE